LNILNNLFDVINKETILNSIEPIIYTQNDKFYIIQNTATNTLKEALYLVEKWADKNINYGYNLDNFNFNELNIDDYDYDLYLVSNDNKIYHSPSGTGATGGTGGTVYKILEISPGKYVALMQLV
jgi:hypothetical protein